MQNIRTISEKLEKAREYEAKALLHNKMGLKPAFHVCAPTGWINDPNGFSSYKGENHLFFQYHPYDVVWGPMHWGHVKTKDFIRWEQLPTALAPDAEYDDFGCFSGSAIEWEGRHVLIYTGVKKSLEEDGTWKHYQTQCVATGDGTDYDKLPVNPVITADSLPAGSSVEDFRDPKAWVDGEYIYLVAGSRSEDGSGQIAMYRSRDLNEWEFVKILDACGNRYGKMWECPDFFKLDNKSVLIVSPQEMLAEGHEFHGGNGTLCIIGNYERDSHEFGREQLQAVDYGLDFYAPQTMLAEDGRRIMIGWMHSWDNQLYGPEQGWSGMMTLPRELSVREGRLYQNPVRELEQYHANRVRHENVSVSRKMELEGVRGRVIDMTVEVEGGEYSGFEVLLAADEHFSTRLHYDRRKSLLTFDRTHSGLRKDLLASRSMKVADRNGKLKLLIIMDRYSAEIFVNDGEQAMSNLIVTPAEADRIFFSADGNAVIHVEKQDVLVR